MIVAVVLPRSSGRALTTVASFPIGTRAIAQRRFLMEEKCWTPTSTTTTSLPRR